MDLMSSTHELGEVQIQIYPNPTSDYLNLVLPENLNVSVKLMETNGKILFNEINQSLIDLKDYAQGIYYLEIEAIKSGSRVVEQVVLLK